MSVVIAAASTKGGVGKTTLTICSAVELRRLGYSVAVLDADPNEPVVAWSQKGADPDIKVVGNMTTETLMPAIRDLRASYDVVLVDLQGAASELMLMTFGRADFVVVPAKASEFDVREAAKTLAAVRRAGELVDREIPVRVVLTMTSPAFRTRVGRNARETFQAAGIPMLDAEFMERTAFREMTFTGLAPNAAEPDSNAAANVRAIVEEILAVVAEAATPAPMIRLRGGYAAPPRTPVPQEA